MTALWSAALPPVDFREVLRYAACRQPHPQTLALAQSAAEEAAPLLRPRLVWQAVSVSVTGDRVDLGFAAVSSQKLALQLQGCSTAVVFAATLGLELDRLLARHSRLQPARAVLLDALGSERIEALCDQFCRHLAQSYAPLQPRPRFSPGYGDLPLDFQRPLLEALSCTKHLGLGLTESLLMTPTKSVSAIVGLGQEGPCRQGCAACEKADCAYRR